MNVFRQLSVRTGGRNRLLTAEWHTVPVLRAMGGQPTMRSFAAESKEDRDTKDRSPPQTGSTTDADNSSKEKTAEEGYKRAREAGEKLTHPEGLRDEAKNVRDTAGDVASGIKQFASKVSEMTKEAAGRASETVAGMTRGTKEQAEHTKEEAKEKAQRVVNVGRDGEKHSDKH